MILKEFFKQDINRNIETVIKADDQEHILQEVEEYVVTHEISSKVRDFFSAYNDYQGANGVWISGFFGSGKSHLLKILSYVLENKEYNGYKLGDMFAGKIEGDEMLKGDVKQSTRIPSESILFNIDQQAQITTKKEEDAVLNVFYKVFNDHLGYFGAQRHVAEFERWLDEENVYSNFMRKYEETAGEPWIKARRKYFDPKVKTTVAAVLAGIFNDSPAKYDNILDTLQTDSRISVEDFCEKVMTYIKTNPRGFRLNFFVDEVGQYISDNTRLMLNMQTIAETLATKTKGQSWIIVTSQEDIEKVMGDLNARQQNDFSRIQARFNLKIPLTSANVDEVIEKRLLAKNEKAGSVLKSTWEKESSNLETLLSFSEAGVQFRGYHGEDDFVNKFPFAPFQFDLFQQCIRALSIHNAFQGKHASVGERSMLGVFQDVVQRIEDKRENTLVSFDLLFEGLRSTVRGEIQNAITLAEKNLDNEFAIRVLKALFLVKYYSNFKTTAHNVSVLMIDDINVDLKKHEQKVQEALNILETQNYIQRNGDLYEFLTDDEKDIQEEIKSMEIDNQQVTQLLKEILFDEIIRDTRIRYLDNKQEYEYTSKIDGIILGRERELTIEIITPNFDDYGNESLFKAQTMGYNTLMMMVLPSDERLMKDMRMYLKTGKYIKQSRSTTNKDNIKQILYDKSQQNNERRQELVLILRKLLGEADVFLNGSKHEMVSTSDGKTKVVKGFQDLIKIAYPSLRMLGKVVYTEDTIKGIIRSTQDDLFGTDDSAISEAESEILNLVVRRKKQSDRTSLQDLREHFSKKPYGWYANGIWSVTARLFKRGKIEIRQDANLLSDEEALDALLNTRTHNNTLLVPQMEVDPRHVRQLSEMYHQMFDEVCPAREAKDMANAFRDKVKSELVAVNQLLASVENYPFLKAMEPLGELMEKLADKEYAWLFTNVKEYEDELLDAKEDVLDPIKKFWHGEQKKIYDSIRIFIQDNQSNLEYIQSDELAKLKEVYYHSKPYSGNLIRDAKTARDTLTQKVLDQIEAEKKSAIRVVERVIDVLKKNVEFEKLNKDKKVQVLKPFNEEIEKLREQRFIANIRQARERVENELLTTQLNEMVKLATPADTEKETHEPKVHYIPGSTIKVNYPNSELRTEADVNEYVEALKKELLKHIRENKRISL